MGRSEGKLVIVNLTAAGGQRLRGQCLLGFWNKLEGNKLGRLLLILLSERSQVTQTWAYEKQKVGLRHAVLEQAFLSEGNTKRPQPRQLGKRDGMHKRVACL